MMLLDLWYHVFSGSYRSLSAIDTLDEDFRNVNRVVEVNSALDDINTVSNADFLVDLNEMISCVTKYVPNSDDCSSSVDEYQYAIRILRDR